MIIGNVINDEEVLKRQWRGFVLEKALEAANYQASSGNIDMASAAAVAVVKAAQDAEKAWDQP